MFPEVHPLKNQPINHLGKVYEGLLSVLLDEATVDGKGSRVEQRWYYALGPGTWPEVLRRYILSSPCMWCRSSSLQVVPTIELNILEALSTRT